MEIVFCDFRKQTWLLADRARSAMLRALGFVCSQSRP
jgi:hypothetical protein